MRMSELSIAVSSSLKLAPASVRSKPAIPQATTSRRMRLPPGYFGAPLAAHFANGRAQRRTGMLWWAMRCCPVSAGAIPALRQVLQHCVITSHSMQDRLTVALWTVRQSCRSRGHFTAGGLLLPTPVHSKVGRAAWVGEQFWSGISVSFAIMFPLARCDCISHHLTGFGD